MVMVLELRVKSQNESIYSGREYIVSSRTLVLCTLKICFLTFGLHLCFCRAVGEDSLFSILEPLIRKVVRQISYRWLQLNQIIVIWMFCMVLDLFHYSQWKCCFLLKKKKKKL